MRHVRSRLLVTIGVLLVPCVAVPQGNPVGPQFRVNSYTPNFQDFPAVAADSSGNLIAVWGSDLQDGSSWGVFGQRYASGGVPVGPEFRVNSYTTNEQNRPAVSSDGAGNFVVVWHSVAQDGSGYGVFGQRYANTGAPLGPEFPVNTYTPSDQRFPAVASDAAGNFVVVWHSAQDGSGDGVFGQRYANTGTPLGAEFRVNAYTTLRQAYPAVASSTAGDFVVVWHSNFQDGSNYGVFGQRYASSGVPLGPEFRANTQTVGLQVSASVASDAAGNFVVAWIGFNQDGSAEGAFGQRYASTGAPLGPEFRINTYTTSIQAFPEVASDAAGSFVVVWQSYGQNGGGFGVFGQRYASTGVTLGPEFRVNSYTPYWQTFQAVASDSSGNFVVMWTHNIPNDLLGGVYGQRYSPIVPVELMQIRVE